MSTTHSSSIPRVLSIAGTDPTGGAGQAADLKAIAAMGGYGMNVITSVVVQNTRGVSGAHAVPAPVVRAQLEAVGCDVAVDAVKVGMLGTTEVIHAVREWLDRAAPPVTVVDPVMVATAGGRLLDPRAEDALRELLPLADLITPNLPELAVLAREPVATTWQAALAQGRSVALRYDTRVLVKGGHLPGGRTPDALLLPGAPEPLVTFDDPRVSTGNTHGTGCSLSSAVATVVARTGDWAEAVGAARQWLRGALAHADELHVGRGNGPVHHFHHVQHLLADTTGAERFTDALWRDCAGVRERIADLEFIGGLADGTLAPETFAWYMDQDMQYLEAYSRALAVLASRAPDEQTREFFASGAAGVVTVESALHRARLGSTAPRPPSELTRSYTDFLLATVATGPFAVGAAAVLPCYWLYATVGSALTARARSTGLDPHPYADWLATYDDAGFQEATERARRVVDRAARGASPETLRAMREAFARASELELRFFAEPMRHAERSFAVTS